MNELTSFNEQVKKEEDRVLSKLRELYQYARSKGFNSVEARLLSRTTRAKIDRIKGLKETKG